MSLKSICSFMIFGLLSASKSQAKNYDSYQFDPEKIIEATAAFVKETLQGEGTGHDWRHAERVWKMALHIGKEEKADLFIIQLGALLHDIADWKFCGGDDTVGPAKARAFLETQFIPEHITQHVTHIIKNVSFKGLQTPIANQLTLEGKIVQDADRLDALGAIGIARTFAYGGHTKRELYNPDIKPEIHTSYEQYKKNSGPTINHFYEKLLHLKDLMNTQTARNIAKTRHQYMKEFLAQFYQEVDGIL